MNEVEFEEWFKCVVENAKSNRYRSLVVLSGGCSWSNALVKKAFCFLDSNTSKSLPHYVYTGNDEQKILTSHKNSQVVNQQTYRHKLGSEVQSVVFQDDNFNVDAFAALSGTVVAGGVFFVILPESFPYSLQYQASLFLQRFWQKLNGSDNCFLVQPSSSISGSCENDTGIVYVTGKLEKSKVTISSSDIKIIPPTSQLNYQCKTPEQVSAVDAVIKVAKGHRKRPLVLTADRGRGKSSALAIACAQLLVLPESKHQKIHVLITAPSTSNVQVFFQQLQDSLRVCSPETFTLENNCLVHVGGIVEYQPIDQLTGTGVSENNVSQSLATPGLLLVDEAAGFPVPLLITLTEKYHRLVFSSTVHGYEGAGRGFTVKFIDNLKEKFLQMRVLHLQQAIRWDEGDPLELFVFDSCLLNASIDTSADTSTELSATKAQLPLTFNSNVADHSLEFNVLDKQKLSTNEAMLNQVFAILVTAHYQTSPNDLKMLLDNDNVDVLTLSHNKLILAVALVVNEGGLNEYDNAESRSLDVLTLAGISSGKRRVKDQFIPQALFNYCGVKHSFDYRYARIMRIAVHPDVQYQGVGQFFVNEITAFAKRKAIDILGTSFGANGELLKFWQTCGLALIRIGFNKDKASGEHSSLMLKSLSEKTKPLVEQLNHYFYQSLPHLLVDEFNSLSNELVWQVLKSRPEMLHQELLAVERQAVADYCLGMRPFSDCILAIQKKLFVIIHRQDMCTEETALLIAKVFQKQSTAQLTKRNGFTGKKMLEQKLRSALNNLSQHQ